jgi:NAD(P)-dependent dehydrogenase (short-subunit alcohol dehydrogenase family)
MLNCALGTERQQRESVMRLSDKRALVTGAGAGIGRAIAQRFAREGAHVAVNDVNAETAEQVAAAIREDGGRAEPVPADCSIEAEVARMSARAEEALGGLDIVVNNAGIEIIKPVVDLTEADWDRLMGINLKGVFFGCKYGIPALERSGGGSIVNMASSAGLIGIPLLSCYCASKGAVIQFTRALAQEYKGTALRFNALCPMLVDTDLGQRFIGTYTDYGIQIMEALEPRQARLATVDEVAAAAVFLASDEESGFINGHALPLDNGATSG